MWWLHWIQVAWLMRNQDATYRDRALLEKPQPQSAAATKQCSLTKQNEEHML
jgi:hypothetical protein